MIEKIFVNSKCVSCGQETPVIFSITSDTDSKKSYQIPLCRECSNKFAEDKLFFMKKKTEERKNRIELMKQEIKGLNKQNLNYKKHIAKLIKKLKGIQNVKE